jgi:hypothetical protein
MAARKTKPAAAADETDIAAARAHQSAQKLIAQAIDLLAAGEPVTPDHLVSAGIPNPVARGRSMVDAQKFRVNWYQIDRPSLNRIARLVVERNWFANPCHAINKAVWGAGFSFNSKEARQWVGQSSYPFRRLHDDMLEEYLVNSTVCAFWRKQVEPGTLPIIEVPDMENVKYETIGGIPQITLTVPVNRKIPDTLKPVIGEKMWDCIRTGKKLVIAKQGPDSEEYDFEILKSGKSTACIPAPRITGILDDLDYIEAVRCGDWNGAWSRREILRHTKKGSGVSSGPNAGTARNNAKYNEIQSILKTMKAILGKTDVATNWDQEIAWLTFPRDFFDPAMVDSAIRRLVFWGGLPAVLLLKTDSQIDGMASYVRDLVRAQVTSFRAQFGEFLSAIFSSPSFRQQFPGAPELVPHWSVKPLYTADGLNKLTSLFTTYGIASPQTLRAMFDIDDEAESALMLESHKKREAYTPPFEPRQGLLTSLFPEDFGGDSPASSPSSLPGEPGRPTGT